ncbi:MAG: hypothetical protein ACP5G2_05500 [Candidatus Bipolaricaulaceae bacterium]
MRRLALVVAAVLLAGWVGWGEHHAGVDVLFAVGLLPRAAGMSGAGLARLTGPDALLVNPAGLGATSTWEVASEYASQFGAAELTGLAAAGPGVGVAVLAVDAGQITDQLSFRTEGAVVGAGLRLVDRLAVGARLRVLHPVRPSEALGWAADVGLRWEGPIALGAVWEAAASRPAHPGESWPRPLAVGVAAQLSLARGTVGWATVEVIGETGSGLRGRLGAEMWAGDVALRAGWSPETITCGLSAAWGAFRLDWATALHQTLPPSFRISLSVMFP